MYVFYVSVATLKPYICDNGSIEVLMVEHNPVVTTSA